MRRTYKRPLYVYDVLESKEKIFLTITIFSDSYRLSLVSSYFYIILLVSKIRAARGSLPLNSRDRTAYISTS